MGKFYFTEMTIFILQPNSNYGFVSNYHSTKISTFSTSYRSYSYFNVALDSLNNVVHLSKNTLDHSIKLITETTSSSFTTSSLRSNQRYLFKSIKKVKLMGCFAVIASGNASPFL